MAHSGAFTMDLDQSQTSPVASPYATPHAAPIQDTNDESDEWEYEYSATETEVSFIARMRRVAPC